MVKRNANTELNHDNWDEEEEIEERGTFVKASEDVLKSRVIKTARRRNPVMASSGSGEGEENSGPKGIFSSFGGFKKPATSAQSFSFLQGSTTPKSDATKTTEYATSSSIFGAPKISATVSNDTNDTNKSETSTEYLAKLKGLNESVSKWIQQHVSSNPLCNLTPIFRDYEKYFNDIEANIKTSSNTTNETSKTISESKVNPSVPSIFMNTRAPNVNPFTSSLNKNSENLGESSKPTGLTFGNNSTNVNNKETSKPSGFSFTSSNANKDATKEVPKPSGFTFGSNPSGTNSKNKPELTNETHKASGFSFGSSSTNSFTFGNGSSSPAGKGFSFGDTAKPFQFQNVGGPPAENKTDTITIEDDEDEPPKVEFKPVVEDGHVYSQRCKVFVKKDGNFVERGVGQLFLKPIPDKDKYQLIVRADTSLGNLLVNIVLSESIPTQRMGKNNVMLVCLPLPEDKEPVPLLLRVKTTEDADKLLDVLNKHKK